MYTYIYIYIYISDRVAALVPGELKNCVAPRDLRDRTDRARPVGDQRPCWLAGTAPLDRAASSRPHVAAGAPCPGAPVVVVGSAKEDNKHAEAIAIALCRP